MSHPILTSAKSASKATPKRTPSLYQQAVYDFLADPKAGNLGVHAVAGSGKTTTLVEAAKVLAQHHGAVYAVAFNKTIATELQTRVGSSAQASTLHSLGLRVLRSMVPNAETPRNVSQYFRAVFKKLVERPGFVLPDGWSQYDALDAITRVVSAIKNGSSPEDEFFTNNGVVPPSLVKMAVEAVDATLAQAKRLATSPSAGKLTIDFDDMIFLPAQLLSQGVAAPTLPTGAYLVDEAQDLNSYQLGLLKALQPARIVFFGDSSQSIYQWRGAMSNSWERCMEAFACTELPLSVSYRCAQSIVRNAQPYCSRIQAAPTAPEGSVTDATLSQLREEATHDDLILCRNNAPLIRLCLRDLREGIPSTVIGRDIQDQLKGAAKKHAQKTLRDTRIKLAMEADRLSFSKRQGARLYADILKCVVWIVDDLDLEDRVTDPLTAIHERIDLIFAENKAKTGRRYTTIHRAKGDEANRVWFYLPSLIPSSFATTPEELQQETNLKYVGITRAKTDLRMVHEEV